jgi:lipoprotein-anchoring transpeptidase ErfK/SrfK
VARRTLAVLTVGTALGVAGVAAQEVVPAPEWARSVEVLDEGSPVHVAPREGAARRGTVKAGTRLTLRRRVGGAGCPDEGAWFEVGDGREPHYVCEAHVRPSPALAGGVAQPFVRPGNRLPYSYAFVGVDGTRAYARPSDYDADQYVEAFGEGFGLRVAGARTWDGLRFIQTRRGLWVERTGLRFARGSAFRGVAVEPGAALDLAWVIRRDARVHERPNGRVVSRVGHRTVLHVVEERPRGWVRLDDGTFIRGRDVARATAFPRPSSVGSTERWVDVDVDQQVMIAYEGDRAVFATLVSTGRRRRTHATPLGEFRIWAKLATSDMDDLERTDVEHNYSIEDVPWVQYFEGSNGFHAAFWHDSFGQRRSHGCVNLSPADAQWLFDWTRPHLPTGWIAILPTEVDPGTLVRVRDGQPAPTPAPTTD